MIAVLKRPLPTVDGTDGMEIILPSTKPVRVSVPTVLNLGSGKDWRADRFNMDVEPRWQPDCLYDLNQPLPESGQLTVPCQRFGTVVLGAETFTEIVAQDVLEHIQELTTAMGTLLHWLRTGGVLKASMPYELSLGAWCDPTHVRAFNERSFDYYTKWSWYLGWRTHHFAIASQEFVATDYGRELSEKGATLEELLRTPRAIDQMHVELIKQPLSKQGRQVTDSYLEPRRESSPPT